VASSLATLNSGVVRGQLDALTDHLQDMDASPVQCTHVPHTALLSNRVPTWKKETLTRNFKLSAKNSMKT
jgi:hypothetical protein